MTESKQLKNVNQLIAYLKLELERNNLSRNLYSTDPILKFTTATHSQHLTKNDTVTNNDRQVTNSDRYKNDGQYENEFKIEDKSLVVRHSNAAHQIDHGKDISAFHIQKVQKEISLKNTVLKHKLQNSISQKFNIRHESIKENPSDKKIGNSQSNYLNKQNNKRLKTKHAISNKQLNITQFYNVVKSINNYEDASTVSGRLPFDAATNRYQNYAKGKQSAESIKENSNSNIDQIDNTIYRTAEHQICELPTSQCTEKSKLNEELHEITFDEFCSNVVTGNDIFSKKSNEDNTLYKENTFFKSFSTGNIIQNKKENYNHIHNNSVPITGYEIRCINKDLGSKKNTFDDFINTILKEVKNDKNSNSLNMCESPNRFNDFLFNSLSKEKNNIEHTLIPFPDSHSHSKESQMLENTNHYLLHGFGQNSTETSEVFDYSQVNLLNDISGKDPKISISKHTSDKKESKNIEDEHKIELSNLILENNESCLRELNGTLLQSTKENSFEEFLYWSCVDKNTDGLVREKRTTDVDNALESKIDLLENNLEKIVLDAIYKEFVKTTEKNKHNFESNDCDNLDDFLNIISGKESKNKNPSYNENNFYIKRYRKGKTKIYKLKKLRRLRKEHLVAKENINEQSKETPSKCETSTSFLRVSSASSISTSSSYVTDNTKSDVLSTDSKELTSPQQRLRDSFNELIKDKSLRYSEKELKDITQLDKENVKMKIQNLCVQIFDDFKKKRTSYFKHKRPSLDNCIFKDGRLQLKPDSESSMTVISSKAKRSHTKFWLMSYIMKKIQKLLETGTKITKRELYYQMKTLINDQNITDRAISSISCLLNRGMWAFNVIAQKGLVFGKLKLILSSGETLNCNIPGTLIPLDINDIIEIQSSAYFILVVEKESIFHKLIAEDLPNKLTRPFIMITGKGFPDLNTQLFLRKLWVIMSIPVFILVDADPHGINIMLNYRFGSANNAHVSQHLAVPSAKWLGVYPSEVVNLNLERQPLNAREIKLVSSLLKTPYMEFSPRLVDELNYLLTKGYKAGIEGLMKTDSYLSEVYLPNKFFTRNFI